MNARCLGQAGAIACLILCAACVQLAAMSVSPIIDAYVVHLDVATGRQIVDLESKQDWAGMLNLARTKLAGEPKRADWWFLQGYAQARQNEHAAAIESFERAVRLSPEDEGAWLAMAYSQSELGRFEAAIETYRRALSYRPESAQAYLGLADIYVRQGKPDAAIRNYRECVRYEPESVYGWYGLASAYQITGQRELRDEAMQRLGALDRAVAERLEKQFSPH